MIESITLTFKSRWRVFLLSLAIQFVISSLIHFGIKAPRELDFLTIPTIESKTVIDKVVPAENKDGFIETILPKLEKKDQDQTIELKKPTSLVSVAHAGSRYDRARSYVVVDISSGEVLSGKKESARLPIASLTKIMTAVVASDLASSEELFRVSPAAAAKVPTKIGVVPNQKLSLDELLHALLLTSANDAAEVIKEGIDTKYGQPVFIKAMNAKAQSLGLKNTHFSNPQGFDSPENFSTAEDLAILSYYALANYPQILEIVQKDAHIITADHNHKRYDLFNWNGLIGVYPGAYGVKIGNTGDAGKTTVVASEREGKRVLVVVLGAPGIVERDIWAADLLDLGFSKLGLDPVEVSEAQLKAKYATWKYWN